MRILRIAVTVLGLLGEPRVLVRVEFLTDASAASQWFHGLFMPPQKVRGGNPGSLSAEPMPLMAAPIV